MNIATVFDRVLPAEAVKLPAVDAKEIVGQLLPHLNSYLMVLERPSYPDVLLGFFPDPQPRPGRKNSGSGVYNQHLQGQVSKHTSHPVCKC
jgi:hypothetical protein